MDLMHKLNLHVHVQIILFHLFFTLQSGFQALELYPEAEL